MLTSDSDIVGDSAKVISELGLLVKYKASKGEWLIERALVEDMRMKQYPTS